MNDAGSLYTFSQTKQLNTNIEATVTVDFKINWAELLSGACGSANPTGFITADNNHVTADNNQEDAS